MRQVTIKSINFIDKQITIFFEQDWFQEDIGELSQSILKRIPDNEIKESTYGADREDIRFQWQHAAFMLNFDYYSQSCWISAHSEMDTPHIERIFNIITQSH